MNNKFKYIILSLIAISLVSCEKWFDVRPASMVLADEQFDKEAGFSDQLTGVYTKLASTSLYGKDMSFGLAEVLSQNYDISSGSSLYQASQYEYDDNNVKEAIASVWTNTYNAIANLNIMLEYIDKVPQSIFSGNNYYIYKGQALGLRAFLHFDMLRLFSSSYAAGGSSKEAIPYVTTYSTSVTSLSTGSEVLEKIKTDLLEALACFDNDKVTTDDELEVYEYTAQSHFNAYAVMATLARIYQWEGDLENAAKYAEKVIADDQFTWTHYSSMESQNEYEWDKTFSPEHIFRLSIYDMSDISEAYFGSTAVSTDLLNISEEKMDQIFEVSSKGYGADYRYAKNYQFMGSTRYFTKYRQYSNGRHNNMIPVIKLSEMYLIAAEAALEEGDVPTAVGYVNEIRENRGGISNYPLEESLTIAEVTSEIYKEYRKETIGEGQLFYYYKRNAYATIPGSSVSATGIYVLPLPENEIEFGDR